MQPPQVQSLSDILAQINPNYDPQRQILGQQIADTQNSAVGQMSALDALKNQAFQGIGQQAQNRGMFFSGFTPNEQATYLSTKYLPSVANLDASTQNNVTSLRGKLADIETTARNAAQTTLEGQQKNYNDWYTQQQQAALEQQKLAQQMAIAQMQDQTTRSGQYASAANRAQSNADKQAAQFKVVRFKSGNYNFTGPNGSPLNMYQYLAGAGLGVDSLRSLLQNGSKYDQTVYNKYKGINDPTAFYTAVANDPANKFYGLQ